MERVREATNRRFFILCSFLATILLCPLSGQAQLAGHNTRGDYGIQSGTLAPPGVYAVGMLYDYSGDTLRDRDGNFLRPDADGGSIGARAAIAGLLWVTDKTFLITATFPIPSVSLQ